MNSALPLRTRSRKAVPWFAACLIAGSGFGLMSSSSLGANSFEPEAAHVHRQLVSQIMPYWYDTSVDRTNGGYLLADDAARKLPPAKEKQLVTQSRMIWGFSHAHLHGLKDGKRDYLGAAAQGAQFLLSRFKDREHGGYFWTTDPAGKALNTRKIVYGQAFVIYGLVECYRASQDKTVLAEAMEQYRTLQRRAYDPKKGGWIEHFERDWTPILRPGPEAIVEVGGFKSANTHLHLMEAFTELYDVTRDPEVGKSLEESLRLNMVYFYPSNAGLSCFHRQLDWSPVIVASSAGLSYGHNVEFAWLMVRAQQALGQPPAWPHFYAHVDHALRYGYDHERGGLYSRGVGDQPASELDKVWWVQSEMVAALTEALVHKPEPRYSAALESLLSFIQNTRLTPKTASGSTPSPQKGNLRPPPKPTTGRATTTTSAHW
jgi:mannobiose 2-epimerase